LREEERRAEEARAALADAVRAAYLAAERAAGSELGIFAHRMKNLVGPAVTASRFLEGKASPSAAEVRRYLAYIDASVRQTHEAATAAMTEAARAGAESATTFGEVVDELRLRCMKDLARTKLEVTGDNPRDVALVGKANVLTECIANLVHNSIDAGARKVTVVVSTVPDAVVLQVVDDGSGVPTDVLPHLFTPGVPGGKGRGHGYGLHFVRVFLETLGGTVTLSAAQPQRGAAFEARLPRFLPRVLPPDDDLSLTLPPELLELIPDRRTVH
jgi:signal transduction histidine kinase